MIYFLGFLKKIELTIHKKLSNYIYKIYLKTMSKIKNHKLDSIESAINDIRLGKVIIVVDDENRENEGDFLAAAETITPEIVNFMAMHGRGLICAPITEKRSKELKLHPMVGNNTDPMETAFTISIDLIGNGVSTGISASDRAKTIRSLTDKNTRPHHISKPGHVFPLIAKQGGVLRRTGHTEAAIDFARLAGFKPAGVIVEIMNEDGSMARLPELFVVAEKFNLKIISIEDLVAYRMEHDSLIEKKEDFQIETRFGSFRLRAYQQTTNDRLHIALTKGTWEPNEHVLTRINSKMINNDILGTLTNNIDKKLDDMFELINSEGKGAVVFINQQNQPLSTLNRLKILKNNQTKGKIIKAPKIEMDDRDFGIGAQILHDINIHKLRLISNSTAKKRVGIIGYGLEIIDYVNY
jgi:3,4-dihydroxy 2-butanone 4-phosphate synthase/GTP cyclohydrolase II